MRKFAHFFRFHRPRWPVVLIGILVFVIAVIAGLVIGYQQSLKPVDSGSESEIRFIVEQGETAKEIASKLEAADLIRSAVSFRIYSELSGTKNNLQAGGYALSKRLSVADIIDHMSTGQTDEIDVLVAPGLTLKDQYDASLNGSLASQGYSEDEITAAFEKTYESPLFASRPAGATLEGYIYPDTYRIAVDDDLSAVLEKSFATFYDVIQQNDIEARLSAHGLTLHQGITLASIIQKEVSNPDDQRIVAQVFYNRLAADMTLGSDVTFLYAAELLGVEPTITVDSPYNTRLYKGLPPGPIANFNLSALLAAADPQANDYLYFVSDVNGGMHYARTEQEHEQNVEQYNSESKTEYSY